VSHAARDAWTRFGCNLHPVATSTQPEALLDKAEHAIEADRVLLDSTGPEFAAGRACYAMFYVAEALLHECGQRLSKHSAVHAAFGSTGCVG